MKSVEEIVYECTVAGLDNNGIPVLYNEYTMRKRFIEALRSVREAALAEGRERERADVVAWLRLMGSTLDNNGCRPSLGNVARQYAGYIEAGDHHLSPAAGTET